jgi:hypothetical protein
MGALFHAALFYCISHAGAAHASIINILTGGIQVIIYNSLICIIFSCLSPTDSLFICFTIWHQLGLTSLQLLCQLLRPFTITLASSQLTSKTTKQPTSFCLQRRNYSLSFSQINV